MKKQLLCSCYAFSMLLFFTYIQNAQAQKYANEWIEVGQNYYKMSIAAEGIYRITFDELHQTNLPLSGNGFQIYRQGQQIPIFTTTESEFSENDYLEFYGQPNDGRFDTQLYAENNWQLQADRSLFTDTATYFLSWSDQEVNARFANLPNDVNANLPAESYFWHEIKQNYTDQFNPGLPTRIVDNEFHADFGENEGFVSESLTSGQSKTILLNKPALYADGPSHSPLTIKFVGQSNDFTVFKEHEMEVRVNDIPFGAVSYEGYEAGIYQVDAPNVLLSSDVLTVDIKALGSEANDYVSAIANISFSYPRKFDFSNAEQFAFNLEDHTEKRLDITNFDGGQAAVLYDLSNHQRMLGSEDGSIYSFHLQETTKTNKRQLFINNSNSYTKLTLKKVEFTNFGDESQQGNYLILSHPQLMNDEKDILTQYKQYRSSAEGGSYQAKIISIEELYDQFAYGIQKHPLAIRHFVNYAVNNWRAKPEYLFIVGKSVSYDQLKTDEGFNRCLVPTYGVNPSDNMLVSSGIDSYQPQIAVGRLSIDNTAALNDYLNKVIIYEKLQNGTCNLADKRWMQNVVHLWQWTNENVIEEFNEYFANYKEQIEATPFNGRVLGQYVQLDSLPVDMPKLGEHISEEGIGLLHFMGQSAEDTLASEIYWNFDIQQPDNYANEGRYPFIISSAAETAKIHDADPSFTAMAHDFVLAKDRGSIGFIGLTKDGYPSLLDLFNGELYQLFAQTNYGESMGKQIVNAIQNIYVADIQTGIDEAIKATCQQSTLVGDPAIRLFAGEQGDLGINEEDKDQFTTTVLNNTFDSIALQIMATIQQVGIEAGEPFDISITLKNPDGSTNVIYNGQWLTAEENILDFVVTLSIPRPQELGVYELVLVIDEKDVIIENCEENNIATTNFILDACPPLVTSIIDVLDIYCPNNDIINLIGIPEGGRFSSPNLLLLEEFGNYFLPIADNISGEHVLLYTYEENGCVYTAEKTIQIAPRVPLEIGLLPDFCLEQETTLYPLSALPAGGVFSGNNLVITANNELDVSNLAPGEYQLTYTFTEMNFGCEQSINVPIAIPEPIDIQLDEVVDDYCYDAGTIIALEGEPMGGQFSSATLEITNNVFLAGTNAIGTHDLMYTVMDENGCSYTSNKEITIHALPEIDLGADTIVLGDEVLILDAFYPNATYLWSDGSTEQLLEVVEVGVYNVTVTDKNGCQTEDSVTVTASVGIHNLTWQNHIRLYPNPVSEQLFISLDWTKVTTNQQEAAVSIFDASGKLVQQQNISSSTQQIDIQGLSAGIYMIQIKIGTEEWQEQVVVQ